MSENLKLIYSNHAKARLKKRGITESEVEYCLQSPDQTYPDKSGNSCYEVTLSSEKRLKVVILKDDPNYVISVMFREKY